MFRQTWIVIALSFYAVLCLGSMATMSLGAGFLIASTPCIRKFAWIPTVREKPYLFISLVLMAICALSLVWSAIHPIEIGGHRPNVHWFKDLLKLWYFGIPIIVWAALRSIPSPQAFRVLRIWLVAFGVLSVVGIIQFYTGWPRMQVIPETNPIRYHATLFLGHHLSVASIFIFPFFVSLGLSCAPDGPRTIGISRKLLIGFTILGGITLILTWARSLWGALPVGLVIWALLSLPKKKAWIAIASLFLIAVALLQVPSIQHRARHSMGIGERVHLWKSNLALFEMRPILGVGWRKGEEMAGRYMLEQSGAETVFGGHAHNNFIEMLSGTGVAGATVWVLWSGFIFLYLFRLRRSGSPFHVGLANAWIAAWVVFQINGLTQVNFWEGKVLHQMMWNLGWMFYFGLSHEEA